MRMSQFGGARGEAQRHVDRRWLSMWPRRRSADIAGLLGGTLANLVALTIGRQAGLSGPTRATRALPSLASGCDHGIKPPERSGAGGHREVGAESKRPRGGASGIAGSPAGPTLSRSCARRRGPAPAAMLASFRNSCLTSGTDLSRARQLPSQAQFTTWRTERRRRPVVSSASGPLPVSACRRCAAAHGVPEQTGRVRGFAQRPRVRRRSALTA